MDDRQPRREHEGGDVLDEITAELAAQEEEDRPPAGGPRHQVAAALAVLALGVFGAVRSLDYGLGRLTQPGPGLWPFVVSSLVVLVSLGLLAWGRRLTDAEMFTRSSVLPAIGVVTFLVLAALLPVIGFEIPAFLLAVVWLRFLGGETWRSTVLVATGTVVAFYLVFVVALSIPMPRLI